MCGLRSLSPLKNTTLHTTPLPFRFCTQSILRIPHNPPNRLTLVVMPSAQSTPARSSNNVPAARSGTSTGPAKRNAAPPSNIQVPGGTKQQMQFPKKSKYSAYPGASSGQFRAGNKPAPKPNARAASDSAAKARAADMAKLSPAIRDLHIRQPYCPAGGSNVQVGQDGLPRLNAPVQTGSSLVSN